MILKLAHQLDPEIAHQLAVEGMSLLGKSAVCRAVMNALCSINTSTFVVRGVKFENRLGVAAGFDKDARAWECLLALGFGHVEVGTLTPLPQKGHPKPRIFRLTEASLANRMGFPNPGAWATVDSLSRPRHYGGLVGANIGPNSKTAPADVPFSYTWSMEALAEHVEYFTVNISSPNSIRHFQSDRKLLKDLFWEIHYSRGEQETRLGKSLPLFVKISPDLEAEELEAICQLAKDYQFDGIVATNTTNHGVSGRQVKERSLRTLQQVREIFAGEEMALVGVGGIETREDVLERFEAGADLLQIYTSFIYQGPGVLRTLFPLRTPRTTPQNAY